MDFRRLQLEFAAHLRDPGNVPPPAGIEPRRMDIYRELFFNNVRDLLAGTFPVCRSILGEDGWSSLVRRFYSSHKARTPYFLELPREFVDWLGSEGQAPAGEPAFLAELAHYEWVELALSVAEIEDQPAGVDPQGDLLEGRPVVSPAAWPLAYRWPVHQLSPQFQPTKPPAEPTFIVVHRSGPGRVGFLQLDAPTARLLELLEGGATSSGRELLRQVAAGLPGAEPERFVEQGARMLESLRERGIVIGTASGG